MDYVFGTSGSVETLKTVGESHTNLTGFQQVERQYPDQTITDCFHIVNKYQSGEDEGRNCYDWYVIDSHYRMVDKSAKNAANIDYLSMMMGINLSVDKEETMDG